MDRVGRGGGVVMFFEGAEKKVEIIISPTCPSLMDYPRTFWAELVHACQATLLSEIENQHVKAYLLSESSLFIWKDRILMLTCGQTRLVESILLFIKKIEPQKIESIVFQRKNEYHSRLQPTDFKEDIERIKELVPGRAFRFGQLHGHYNLLFHLDRSFQADQRDKTTEFFVYDISPESSSFLTRDKLESQEVRSYFQLEKILKGFTLDDFVFRPYGYSLNGIRDDKYYTIHVTPQEVAPYISFETNLYEDDLIRQALNHLLDLFRPKSFDLMAFNTQRKFEFERSYFQVSHIRERLLNGYEVDFYSYYSENKEPQAPIIYEWWERI